MSRTLKAGLLGTALMVAGPAFAADPNEGVTPALGLRAGSVHLGLAYSKQADDGTLLVGGFGVPGADYETLGGMSGAIEVGVFLRDGFAISLSGITPVTTPNIAAGTLAGFGNLGDETAGFYSAAAHYHFNEGGRVSAYAGGGIGYMHVFNTNDGVLSNLNIRNALGAVLQAGVEVRMSERVGAYLDVKRYFLQTIATGNLGATPVVAKTNVDPWVVSAGLSLDY